MKIRQIAGAVALSFAAWLASGQAAHADMIIYDSMNVFQGQQSFTDTFTVAQAGTLTLAMNSEPWFGNENLSFFLSSPTGALGTTIMGSGSESINVAAGTYYANWVGTAENSYNLGVVGVDINFHPNGTTVSLPTSIVLMLSGLGLLFAWPRIAVPAPSTSRAGAQSG